MNHFLRDDAEARQRGRTERCRDRDVSRVTAAGDEDPTYPGAIVTGIESVPTNRLEKPRTTR